MNFVTSLICSIFPFIKPPIHKSRHGNASRKRARSEEQRRLKEKVKDAVGLMAHSDGKRQEEFGELKERMPILLSGFSDGSEHLLDIPVVSDGTGKTSAHQIFDTIEANDTEENDIKENLVGVSGDTYNGNRGHKTGQWVELERKLGRPLMKAPCRHHAVDLLPKAAYKEIFGPSKGLISSEFVCPSIRPSIHKHF